METLKIDYSGKFYGVVGKNKAILVPYIYDEIIRTFSSGLINVCKNDKWGCLDLDGNVVIPLVYDWIFPFGKDPLDTTGAKRNGKWGIIDRKGNVIIPCVYDEEIVFKHERAIVSMDGKKGMIDIKGNTIIPCQYTYLKPFVQSSKLIKVMENDKWGVLYTNGNVLIPLSYDEIGELFIEYIVVKQNDHYGLVNIKGEFIIPPAYDEIDKSYHDERLYEISSSSEYFSVKKNKKWKYLLANNDCRNNNEYDWISGPFEYDNYIVKQNEKFGIVNRYGTVILPSIYEEIHTNHGFYVLCSKGQKGLCDNNGKLIIPFSYDNIEIISRKSAIIEKEEKYSLFFFDNAKAPIEYDGIRRIYGAFYKVTKNGKCGIMDDQGNIIIPMIYDYIHHSGKKNIEVVKGDKYGIIDLSGNTIIPIVYDVIDKREVGVETDNVVHRWTEYIGQKKIPPMYGDAIIMRYDGKYGVVNSKGIERIPFEYDNVVFFGGALIVKLKNKFGVIDINKKIIIPIIYDDITPGQYENFLWLREKKLWGIVNLNGNTVIPINYNKIDYSGGLFLVKLGNKYGALDINNKQIVATVYDEIIHDQEENILLVRNMNLWGMLNMNGLEIMPLKYENTASHFSCHRLAVCQNKKWGFVNEKGVEVIKCIYDEVLSDCFDGNDCYVKLDGALIKIDKHGKRKR